MIDTKVVCDYLKRKNINVEEDYIKKIIEEENYSDILESQKSRFSYEVWDKKSDINGVSAQEIIKSRDYVVGNAFLIYVDKKLVYFQDHNPNKEGYEKMTKKQAETIAKEFIDSKVKDFADTILFNIIIKKITK